MSYGPDEVDEADDDEDSGEYLPSIFNIKNFQVVSCILGITVIIIIIITSASVELTQTHHSHSKQLFHGGQILVFLLGGSKSFIRCL